MSGVSVLLKAFFLVQDDEANIFKKVDDDDKGNQLNAQILDTQVRKGSDRVSRSQLIQ